jgi:hypothetical protein
MVKRREFSRSIPAFFPLGGTGQREKLLITGNILIIKIKI